MYTNAKYLVNSIHTTKWTFQFPCRVYWLYYNQHIYTARTVIHSLRLLWKGWKNCKHKMVCAKWSGSDVYNSKWKYYSQLMFLRDSIETSVSTDNLGAKLSLATPSTLQVNPAGSEPNRKSVQQRPWNVHTWLVRVWDLRKMCSAHAALVMVTTLTGLSGMGYLKTLNQFARIPKTFSTHLLALERR